MTRITIGEVFEYCREIKSNRFSDNILIRWLNEIEGMVQTEVMLLPPEKIRDYAANSSYANISVAFPTSNRLVLPHRCKLRAGGILSITGCDMVSNNKSLVIRSISEDGLTVLFDSGNFTVGTSKATLVYDGLSSALLVPAPWYRLYYSYLLAKISEALEEAGEQNNRLNTFYEDWRAFCAWFADAYNPANGEASFDAFF